MRKMKYRRYKNVVDMAEDMGFPREIGILSELKGKLTTQIRKSIEKQGLTHAQVAERSGIPRSAITGIVNNGLQRVTLDRLVRILCSLGHEIQFKIKAVS